MARDVEAKPETIFPDVVPAMREHATAMQAHAKAIDHLADAVGSAWTWLLIGAVIGFVAAQWWRGRATT